MVWLKNTLSKYLSWVFAKRKKIHGLFLDLPWHSPSLVGVISIVKYCYNLLAEREREFKNLASIKANCLELRKYIRILLWMLLFAKEEREEALFGTIVLCWKLMDQTFGTSSMYYRISKT